jgi:hypothetical protein
MTNPKSVSEPGIARDVLQCEIANDLASLITLCDW